MRLLRVVRARHLLVVELERSAGPLGPPSRGGVDEPNAHVAVDRRRRVCDLAAQQAFLTDRMLRSRLVRNLAAQQAFLADRMLRSRLLPYWRPAPHCIPRQGAVKRVHIGGAGRERHWEKSTLSQASSCPADLLAA